MHNALTAAPWGVKRCSPGFIRGHAIVKIVNATLVATSLVAASLVTITPVAAQKLDLSTVTCKQFLDSGERTMSMVLMWLTGFFTDEDEPPVVDFDKLKIDAGKLGDYCRKNPTTNLMNAAEEVLQ
jgi:acid stress chaperone HdeB